MAGHYSSFKAFSEALEHTLRIGLASRQLDEGAWLLYSTRLSIQVAYYALAPFRKRVPIASNLRCIHIDEDTWMTRPSLLLTRLAALAGQASRIYARDTVASRIDKPMALSFQQEHHLQVPLPGKYRYGLFHEGELMAMAVFSGGRNMNGTPAGYRSFELLRFCHKQGVLVVGGFSKLLDAFQRVFHPGDIMTYADSDWSDGSSYETTGFKKAGYTDPQLFWVDTRTMSRYHERALPAELRRKSAEERQELGYLPIYNSGSIKFVKIFN